MVVPTFQGLNPGSAIDYANQAADIQQQQAMYAPQLQQAQAVAQAAQDQAQNNRRSMAISLLTPTLNQGDPERQQSMYSKLAPWPCESTRRWDSPTNSTPIPSVASPRARSRRWRRPRWSSNVRC